MNIHDKNVQRWKKVHFRSIDESFVSLSKFSAVRISLPTAQKEKKNCTEHRNEHGEQINSVENNYAIKLRKTETGA